MSLSKETELERISQQIEESCAVKKRFSAELQEAVWTLASRTAEAYGKGNKVLLMGNGGSAADAQHIAAELVGRFLLERKPLPALALTTNSSILTAIDNDTDFEHSFVRQIEAHATAGDIAVLISTSGNSPNVIAAAKAAHRSGCYTAAFTGHTGGKLAGGKLAGNVDLLLAVPSDQTPRIQEAHILLGHLYCDLVEQILFGNR